MSASTQTPAKILIAEDSPTQAQRLQYILEQQGYQVAMAANGRLALELARQFEPTLVISDVVMPEMDGYELSRRIKADSALRDIPVILVTTMSDPQDVIRGLECGADNFVLKPYDERYLLGRVRYVLANREFQQPQDPGMGVELYFHDKKHYITAGRLQILNLLLSTYDAAIQRNAELSQAQEELRAINAVLAETNRRLEQEGRQREQAQQSLRESEQRLRSILDNMATFIGEITPDGVLVEVNRAALEAGGLQRQDVIGKQFTEAPWFSYSPAVQARLGEGIERALRGQTVRHDMVARMAGGALVPIEFMLVPVRDSAGRVVKLIPSGSDITERKYFEQTLQEKNAALEAASRAKSDFLANMSHELRTPLNSIIGFSEMLKDGVLGKLEAKQRGFVADILDAGTHLLSLINDILDLSKVEAGMLQLEAGAVDVPALLKASMMVVREKALTHRIRLDTELDPGLGTLLVDERKVKQIVYNLLSNAVKFTPEGGTVTLRARLCTRSEVALDAAMPGRLIALPPGEDGEFLAITVEDSGKGIAEEHLAKLFEPFTQVDSSIARRQGGTGLGLSLVRRLAELHGGTVGLASRPGTGSAFSVWLPYREATPAVQETRAIPEGAASSTPEAMASTTPAVPLALVIEDDDRIAELIEAQLRAEGFEVMRAATAEEGLVRAAKRRPQLITLDIFLPAMDGWEFMRRLKADPNLTDTPVVIISMSEDRDHGLALGARRVLQKPFVREELIAALVGLVDVRPNDTLARVLVVDDNVKAVGLLATVLEAESYRVLRAYGGAEAIEAARRTPPDLVILDLMMPEVSGFEVARALRESEHTARIPILVLTAKDVTAEDRARLKGSVSAILAKADFNASELLAELRRALP